MSGNHKAQLFFNLELYLFNTLEYHCIHCFFLRLFVFSCLSKVTLCSVSFVYAFPTKSPEVKPIKYLLPVHRLPGLAWNVTEEPTTPAKRISDGFIPITRS